MSGFLGIPLMVMTDSYKVCHSFLFPETKKCVAYGEFRKGFNGDEEDKRVLFYGMRYIIEHYVAIKWTKKDVELSEKFFATHNAAFTPFKFPKDLFLKFIEENNGYFPVKIEALPEGTSCYVHTPVYQITAEKEYSPLVTYLETIITMAWYPSTVATLSRRSRDRIEKAFQETVDDDAFFLLESRLHDFGFRGCTCIEQSILGGSAHLLNFEGTDTMSAAYYAQYVLNNGNPVANSIPATEHSIMTAHKNERDAVLQEISQFGDGIFACVMDSYDYSHALEKLVPSISKKKIEKGGFMVLRPDSGDQVEVVLMALRAADKVFGSDTNKKGYKIIRGASVIQGDAVTPASLEAILKAVKKAGYAAQCVGFGMGGGLLQKINRDTMSFATKLSHIVYADGTKRDIMKTPKADSAKISLPGEFGVKKNEHGIPIVYPREVCPENDPDNLLKVVYDKGWVNDKWEDFDTIKNRIAKEWPSLPPSYDIFSPELKAKIEKGILEIKNSQLSDIVN